MYKMGVDLGGTNIVAGVVNEKNEIIARHKVKTNCPRPAEEIFADIVLCIKEAVNGAGLEMKDIESIGIGTPGSVNKECGRIEYANNLAFEKVPAAELINKEIPDVKVYIENDANCAALGEAIAGAGAGKKSFVAVTLGTGVGAGYILDGKLVTGCNDAGGEFGHMVINFEGEMCNCGRRGCWERYASATALVNQTKAAMLEDKNSKMWEACANDINNASGRTAFDMMRAGDETAKKVVENYFKYIAVGTVNIVNALQPDMICFGGGISNEKDNLIKPLQKLIDEDTYSRYATKQTEICCATLGNDAGIIGAALVKY